MWRPQAVFLAARGNLPEPDVRAGAAEMCTEGLIPSLSYMVYLIDAA